MVSNPIQTGGAMSISVSKLCWDKSIHGSTELLVLLAIADFSDESGSAYPSVSTLANKCRMGRRNVQYILKQLEDSGELVIEHGKGPAPKFPNLYRVDLNKLGMQSSAQVKSSARVQSKVARGAIQRTNDVQTIAPKPSLTIKNHQMHFSTFWSAYPNTKRKGSKSECVKVWERKSLDTEAEQIISHVKAMANSDDWQKESGKYVPAPLTYLNQMKWDGAELQMADNPFEGVI